MSKYHLSKEEIAEEETLIIAASKNTQDFGILYNRYHERIFLFVHHRLDELSIAEDITCQVFYKAMIKISSFKFQGLPFSSWLFRIAHNELCNYFKKHKASRTINIDSTFIKDIHEEENDSEEEAALVILSEILTELPEEELQLIEMRFFQKMSFKELGEIMDITENNAKVRTYRTLDKLKKMMMDRKNLVKR